MITMSFQDCIILWLPTLLCGSLLASARCLLPIALPSEVTLARSAHDHSWVISTVRSLAFFCELREDLVDTVICVCTSEVVCSDPLNWYIHKENALPAHALYWHKLY